MIKCGDSFPKVTIVYGTESNWFGMYNSIKSAYGSVLSAALGLGNKSLRGWRIEVWWFRRNESGDRLFQKDVVLEFI